MLKLFKPAPPIERMPDDQIDSEYKKFRLQVFSASSSVMRHTI